MYQTSAGGLRSIDPSLGMRQLFGDVTIGEWHHKQSTQLSDLFICYIIALGSIQGLHLMAPFGLLCQPTDNASVFQSTLVCGGGGGGGGTLETLAFQLYYRALHIAVFQHCVAYELTWCCHHKDMKMVPGLLGECSLVTAVTNAARRSCTCLENRVSLKVEWYTWPTDTWTCSDTQTKSLCTIPSEKYSFHIVRRWGSSNQGSPGVGKHHVNNKKTKFLVSAVGPGVLKKSGKYPVLSAAVVLVSAIIPSHARSASCGSTRGAAASLVADPNSYMCNGKSGPIDGWPMTQVDVNCTMLDVVDIFCCLGDILCSGWALGKVQETIATRHLVPNAPITPVYALVTILDFDQIVWQRP